MEEGEGESLGVRCESKGLPFLSYLLASPLLPSLELDEREGEGLATVTAVDRYPSNDFPYGES